MENTWSFDIQMGIITTLQVGDPQWDAYLSLDGTKRELTCAGVGSACLVAFGAGCGALGAWFQDGQLDRTLGLVGEYGVGFFEKLSFGLTSAAWWTPVILVFFCVGAFSAWGKRVTVIRASRAGNTSATILNGGELSALFGLVFYLGLGRVSIVGLLGYIACMTAGLCAAILQERRRVAKLSNPAREYLHHVALGASASRAHAE